MFMYSESHNHAFSEICDCYAWIIINIPDFIIDQLDACFENNDKIDDIIEVKIFWNLTNESIIKVIQDSSSSSKSSLIVKYYLIIWQS